MLLAGVCVSGCAPAGDKMSFIKQIVICAVVLAVAAGGWFLYQSRMQAPGGTETAGGGNGQQMAGAGPRGNGAGAGGGRRGFNGPALVVPAHVTMDDFGAELQAIGSLESAQAVTIFPQAAGTVTEIAAKPGAGVKRGDVLFLLDDADQKIAVERAELSLTAAQAAADRADRLAQTQNITDVALAEAKNALASAQIDERAAQLALERRRIVAPFDGTVGLIAVSVGDLVGTTTALTTLDDMSTFQVSFTAPQSYIDRMAVGHPVTATAEGAPGQKIAGEVTAIDSRVDQATRSFTARATLSAGIAGLKPGMAVQVNLSFEGKPSPAVPSLAVQWDRAGPYVWKLEGDKVKRTDISIIGRRAGVVIVAADLTTDDEVIVEGLQRLRDGATVTRAGSSSEVGARRANDEAVGNG